MDDITIICGGYNEAKRANLFFKSIAMFPQIIFINKNCTDRTCEIARRFPNVEIYDMEYQNTPEKEHLIIKDTIEEVSKMVKNKWILALTFADVVHPRFYEKVKGIINRRNFHYQLVMIPWIEYLMGKQDECIPYCHYCRPVLKTMEVYRNSTVRTHHEASTKDHRIYHMKKDKVVGVHHLTYVSLAYSFKEQQVRYSKKEVATHYALQENPMKMVLWDMIKRFGLDLECIIGGVGKSSIKMLEHGFMISIYRTLEYYWNMYLILWAMEKESNMDEFFQTIYDSLKQKKNTGKISMVSLIKIYKNVAKNKRPSPSKDLVAVFGMLMIKVIIRILAKWDNKQELTVKQQYTILKKKILTDKL